MHLQCAVIGSTLVLAAGIVPGPFPWADCGITASKGFICTQTMSPAMRLESRAACDSEPPLSRSCSVGAALAAGLGDVGGDGLQRPGRGHGPRHGQDGGRCCSIAQHAQCVFPLLCAGADADCQQDAPKALEHVPEQVRHLPRHRLQWLICLQWHGVLQVNRMYGDRWVTLHGMHPVGMVSHPILNADTLSPLTCRLDTGHCMLVQPQIASGKAARTHILMEGATCWWLSHAAAAVCHGPAAGAQDESLLGMPSDTDQFASMQHGQHATAGYQHRLSPNLAAPLKQSAATRIQNFCHLASDQRTLLSL